MDELTFTTPQAVIFERRTSDGKLLHVVGVTNGVRTIEKYLRGLSGRVQGGWLSRGCARKHHANLQHDLDRGLIKPRFDSAGTRRATPADLTGWVSLADRQEESRR